MFADQSGMNASGHVMLGTTDVHHQWTKVMRFLPSASRHVRSPLRAHLRGSCASQMFEQLPAFRILQQQTEWLKERISLLLGGTRVVHTERLGPVEPITELYGTLYTFHNNLISQRLCLHPRSLEGLNMILEKYTLSFLNDQCGLNILCEDDMICLHFHQGPLESQPS